MSRIDTLWRPGLKHGMEHRMTEKKYASSTGSGAIIALLTLAGTFIGGYALRQPVIGFLGGFGCGIVIALLLWLKERKA
ncbi:MAG: hypothetical protein ABI395_03270 [Sphingobium sp.]